MAIKFYRTKDPYGFLAALAKKRVVDLRLEGIFHFVKKSSGQAIQLVMD